MPTQPTISGSIEDRLQHGTFRQPSDASQKVWRYMDLAKFTWLLSERKLTLARLDGLSDSFEGTLTAKTVEWIQKFLRDHKSKDGWDVVAKHFRDAQRTTFVSCWHANEHESEAMWRLYCGQGAGVAVQTTYQKLVTSISDQPDVYIGCVKYIDYEHESIPEANAFAPAMHKRVAFAHEREVRLVTSPSKYRVSLAPEAVPTVVTLPWDCEIYADRIHVSPYAHEYFYEAARAVIQALSPALQSRLVWSYMKAAPVL
jgi:hypothetical protein